MSYRGFEALGMFETLGIQRATVVREVEVEVEVEVVCLRVVFRLIVSAASLQNFRASCGVVLFWMAIVIMACACLVNSLCPLLEPHLGCLSSLSSSLFLSS